MVAVPADISAHDMYGPESAQKQGTAPVFVRWVLPAAPLPACPPKALANFRQMALLAGKRLTDEEAARWITTGAPRVPYTPGLPESGAALRAAALALSAKAIAIQAQRLKELRAASQIN